MQARITSEGWNFYRNQIF